MKSKKKLLLMGVGVMGALAMGVGATSTFAWFTASAAARLMVNSQPTQIGVSKEGSLQNFDINVNFTMHVTDPCDLTDDAGNVYYMYNGTKRQATTGIDPVGSYYLTAEFTDTSTDAANIASINGKHFSFELSPAANQNIRLINTGAATAVEGTNTANTVTIYAGVSGTTITLYRDSGYTEQLNNTYTLEYAVRANADRNEAWATTEYTAWNDTHAAIAVGALYSHENKVYVVNAEIEVNGTWAANSAKLTELSPTTPTFDSSLSYSVGDSVIYSNEVYVCTTAHSGAWDANNFAVAKLHSNDKIVVGNGTQLD